MQTTQNEYQALTDYLNMGNLPKDIDITYLALQYYFNHNNIKKTGVIHLGGHLGEEIPMYINLGFKKIIIVEPQPRQFARMTDYVRNITDCLAGLQNFLNVDKNTLGAKIQCYQYAISNKSGKVPFHTMGFTAWSSLIEPNPQAFNGIWNLIKSSIKQWYWQPFAWLSFKLKAKINQVIEVQAITLDELMCNLNESWQADDFSYLRMNIQGAELMALQGGENTLQHLEAIFLETNLTERYHNAPTKQEFDEFLAKKGFVSVLACNYGPIGNVLYIKKTR